MNGRWRSQDTARKIPKDFGNLWDPRARPSIPDLVKPGYPKERNLTKSDEEKVNVLVESFSSVFTKENLDDMPVFR